MKIRRVSICCRVLFVAFLSTICTSDVSAQFISGAHSGLSASGSTEVAIVPTRLRLELQIQAEGRDAKTALKALADHKKAVQEGLIAMKAEADSIEFSGHNCRRPSLERPKEIRLLMESSCNGPW